MVSIMSLWLPILLSAVIVFIASSIIHMLLPYHKKDFTAVPDEDKVREALGPFKIPPGDYVVPHAEDSKEMSSPEYIEKVKKGPALFMTVMENKIPNMGKSMALWFIYLIFVGILTAYITGNAVNPGEPYLRVFRFAGATSFIALTMALWQNTIWYKRSLRNTVLTSIDGFIYSLLIAGTFGWLWPGM